MEEEGQDLSVFGQETIFNEDAKFYKDVYVFGKLYYDFESGATEKFGDVEFDGNARVGKQVEGDENDDSRESGGEVGEGGNVDSKD